jgi:predicted Zn finger-like uncharacterized protein
MALITRCPVCGTRFKVVPDQLRISDGWVRCGECGEVFDASADLSQGELPPQAGASPGNAREAAGHQPAPSPSSSSSSSSSSSPSQTPGYVGFASDPPKTRPQSDWHAPWSSRPPTVVSGFQDAAPTLASTGGVAPAARIDWDAEASFSDAWLRKRDASYGDDVDGADSMSLPASLESRQSRRVTAEPAPAMPTLPADPADPADSAELAEPPAVEPLVEPVSATEDTDPRAEVDRGETYQHDDEEEEEDAEEVSQALAAFPADMSTLPEDTVYVVPPPPAEVDAALDEPRLSFLKAPAPPVLSRWQRPWVRPLLFALAGLLTVQIAVQQRDQLAAQLPAVRPLLHALCAPLGCTVQPLRRIDSIVIDNSTFTTLRHGVYRLNVVLKNRSATELAVPSIELALTDTQEQPVLRRVLQPVDMASTSGNRADSSAGNIDPIAPEGEWTASMELTVAEEALIGRIVGYRLLAFYP